MFALIKIIKSFLAGFVKSQDALDEAFLSESTDRYDLERRLRVIDGDRFSGAGRYGAWHLDALR